MSNKRFSIFLIVLLILVSFSATVIAEDEGYISEKAKVLKVGEVQELEDEFYIGYMQEIEVEILSGDFKGERFVVEHNLSENDFYNIIVKENDMVMVSIENDENNEVLVNIIEFYRSGYIKILVILFLLIVLILGKTKGLRAIISLIVTIFLIIYVLLPGILNGKDPLFLSIIIAIITTVITILLIGGFNKKSYSAIIGTSLGVIIAGFISLYIGKKMNLTGKNSEEVAMLMFIPQGIDFNYLNLLFSGIILGALGAVMDVGMSIASSIDEIYNNSDNISKKDLFLSGMNIGKDIMGTMINTLILAYTGSSIPMLLLFTAYNLPVNEIINMDLIATEIVRSLSGSIGLVLTIPITAVISTLLIYNDKKEEDNLEIENIISEK